MTKKYEWIANIAIVVSLLSLIQYSDNRIVAFVTFIILIASLDYKYKENWFK